MGHGGGRARRGRRGPLRHKAPGGASNVITLPWFKNTYPNGEYIYMLVWGGALVGRALGGAIHYRLSIRAQLRYRVALSVYLLTALLEGFYLFCPLPVMALMCFGTGIFGVTSYTIRISATQSYVPDEKKGRFNGAFNMLSTAGALLGEVLAGALSQIMPERSVLLAETGASSFFDRAFEKLSGYGE